MTEKQLLYQIDTNFFGAEAVIRRNTLKSNVIQSITSAAFLLAVIGTVIVLFIGVAADMITAFQSKELLETGWHLELVTKAAGSEPFMFAFPVLSAVPKTTSYMDELKIGYVKEYLPRTTRKQYIFGKAAACMPSGGAAVICGIVIFICLVTIMSVPVELPEHIGDADVLAGGLDNVWTLFAGMQDTSVNGTCSDWIKELFQTAVPAFLAGVFWSFVGMAMASFTSNRYMAYGGPFIIYYVLVILCERYFPSCYVLYPKEWLEPSHIPFRVWGMLVIYAELWCLMMGCFWIRENRRLRML